MIFPNEGFYANDLSNETIERFEHLNEVASEILSKNDPHPHTLPINDEIKKEKIEIPNENESEVGPFPMDDDYYDVKRKKEEEYVSLNLETEQRRNFTIKLNEKNNTDTEKLSSDLKKSHQAARIGFQNCRVLNSTSIPDLTLEDIVMNIKNSGQVHQFQLSRPSREKLVIEYKGKKADDDNSLLLKKLETALWIKINNEFGKEVAANIKKFENYNKAGNLILTLTLDEQTPQYFIGKITGKITKWLTQLDPKLKQLPKNHSLFKNNASNDKLKLSNETPTVTCNLQ